MSRHFLLKASLLTIAAACIAVLGALPEAGGQKVLPKKKDKAPFNAAAASTGYVRPPDARVKAIYAASKARNGNRVAAMALTATPPAKFDCVDMGWCLKEMGDQGSCGSCYLYSTVEAATEAWIKAGYGKNDGSFQISVQYGMDCHNFGGCGGGWGAEVIDWMAKNGFPAYKCVDSTGKEMSDYPEYEARSRTCRTKAGAKLWKPADWGFAAGDQSDRPATVPEIKACLMQYGVLNVALAAGGQFGNYDGTGVITSMGSSIDHEITMVGWDDAKGGGAWKVRNQWGEGWGDNGYGWIAFTQTNRLVDIFWISINALPPPPPPDGKVVIAPVFVSMTPGSTQQFTVAPAGSYNWSSTGGGITTAGLYTAPSTTGSYTVTVTSTTDTALTASASVTVSTTPVPPPTPGVATITLDKPLAAGTYQLVPPGFELAPTGTLLRLKQVWEEYEKLAPKAIAPITPKILPEIKESEPPMNEPTLDELSRIWQPHLHVKK